MTHRDRDFPRWPYLGLPLGAALFYLAPRVGRLAERIVQSLDPATVSFTTPEEDQ